MSKPKKPIADLLAGNVYSSSGGRKHLSAKTPKKGVPCPRGPSRVVGRADYRDSEDFEKALQKVAYKTKKSGHRLRLPDGSIEDLEDD